MTTDQHPRWVWEATDPTVNGSSGDISKLFRNEVVKNPGVFAADAPSDIATLMAREVIQNSADAANELLEELGDDAPEFEIDFEFETFDGDDKATLVDALDLGSLADRIAKGDDGIRGQLGLSMEDCLGHLDDAGKPLRTLKIIERGTTGMYGPFVGARSKLYLALISLGYTVKSAGSGGSYGYGKAGLIRGSKTRSVIAYTRFRERDDDPGITRRLLGMTYWGQHDAKGESYTGFARFGHDTGQAVLPFENEAADAVAEQLGLEVRDPMDDDDLGTTFLLVDPGVESDDLVSAIERNWWPAIEDDRLTATVIDSGKNKIPRPRTVDVLKPFIEAYDLALSSPDNLPNERKRAPLSPLETSDGETLELGTLGLVAESGGWSYASTGVDDNGEEDGEVAHRSLVALIRGPRMIVEYLEAGQTRPFVRGAFVADEAVDELLRQTEPKAHDAWQTRVDEGGVDPVAPRVAKAIIDRVKRNVNDFRRSLKPPPRPAEDVRLPELERLFRGLFRSKGKDQPPPPPGDRPFSIKVSQRLVADDAEMTLRLTGTVKFALFDRDDLPPSCDAEIALSYRIMEEGGVGEELPLSVTAPEGFEARGERPYTFRGQIDHDHVEFEFESAPYPADWTGRLKADADMLEAHEAEEATT